MGRRKGFPLVTLNSNREATYVLSPFLRGQAQDEIEHFSICLHLTQVQDVQIDVTAREKLMHILKTGAACAVHPHLM